MNSYSELDDKMISFEKFLEYPSLLRPQRIIHPGSRFMLVLADFGALVLSVWLIPYLLAFLDPNWSGPGLIIVVPLMFVFCCTYNLVGLYRLRSMNQVEEIHELTSASTIIFLSFFVFNILMGATYYPVFLLAISWLAALGFIPLARMGFRHLGSRLGIWGEPVVILGSGEMSHKIIRYLQKNPYYGLRPELVVDGMLNGVKGSSVKEEKIPTISIDVWQSTVDSKPKFDARTVIVVTPEIPDSVCESLTNGDHFGFMNIITVSRQFITRNAGLTTLDFGGVLGIEERHFELGKFETLQIRILDLLLIFLALPVLIPIFLFIIVAIRLDSKGGAFYRQTRIGKDGVEFKVLKFRTMVKDADKILKTYLEQNPQLMAEWKADHKLRQDPRITRIGNLLRKTSLDELPQIWNIVKGEMSIVGPRPIVAAEIERYGDRFKYYTQVLPGLTGLWQVSGRNDVSYDQRVLLDVYYVRNRSILMNFYIMVRTTTVVLRRKGAY